MDAAFWHQRWQQNELGFQLDDTHPLLKQCFSLLAAKHTAVFVPLSGKSADMVYLAQHLPVTGCELSPIACQDFFSEQGLSVQINQTDHLVRYEAEAITLWQGDFFELTTVQVEGCTLVYDRAALIALPAPMRQRYAAKLHALFPQGCQILLISLEYPQHEKQGPPFNVGYDEVTALFPDAIIEQLADLELTGKGFARRRFATSSLVEKAYLITLPAR